MVVYAEVHRAEVRWRRGGLAWETVCFVIARDPEIGVPITESGITRALTIPGSRAIDEPTVTVVYEIQPDLIIVHDIRFEDAESHQAGSA